MLVSVDYRFVPGGVRERGERKRERERERGGGGGGGGREGGRAREREREREREIKGHASIKTINFFLAFPTPPSTTIVHDHQPDPNSTFDRLKKYGSVWPDSFKVCFLCNSELFVSTFYIMSLSTYNL